MTPYKQLIRHNPGEGQIGDCWRTAFGCLLDLPPDQVPHFVDGHWGDGNAASDLARRWLAGRGLSFVEHAFACDLDQVLAHVGCVNPGVHYLLAGASPRGTDHSVVCCGDRIMWGPHPDGGNLVGPQSDGYFWVLWLVPSFLCLSEVTSHNEAEAA